MGSLGKRLVEALGIGLFCAVCASAIAVPAEAQKNPENASSTLISSLERETSLPVHDNRFVVDQNIQSLQIIINTDNVTSIKILGPAGKEVFPLQNAPGVTWQQIDKLYGITLEKPEIGQWEIKGSMQAIPKVIIDSNLKMITPDFPNNLFRGETLAISAYLTNNNKRITTPDLLDQTQFFATLHNVATLEKYKIFLTDEETKPQGVFHFDYELKTLPGVYRITIQAISLLFQRQQEQQFYLYDYPAMYTTKVVSDTDELLVEVTLQSPILDEPTCRFNALFMSNDGEISSTRLAKIADKKWQLFMPISDATHKMNLLLNAFTIDRRLINITFPDVDVFAMYQQNLTDVKTLWAEKWRLFWQNNQSEQLGYLFGFSKEKFLEEWLFLVNNDLPVDAVPLKQYPTQLQSLLTTWEPIIYDIQPKTLVDKIKVEQAKEKAIAQAKENVAHKAKSLAAAKPVVHQAPVSPWRKWVIALLVVLVLLFLGLLLAIAWMFKPAKVQAIYQGMVQTLQAIFIKLKGLVSQLKALKSRLPGKAPVPSEAAPATTETQSAEATTAPTPNTESAPAEVTAAAAPTPNTEPEPAPAEATASTSEAVSDATEKSVASVMTAEATESTITAPAPQPEVELNADPSATTPPPAEPNPAEQQSQT